MSGRCAALWAGCPGSPSCAPAAGLGTAASTETQIKTNTPNCGPPIKVLIKLWLKECEEEGGLHYRRLVASDECWNFLFFK